MYHADMKKILLPDDLHQALKIEAVREGLTLQDFIALRLRNADNLDGSPVAVEKATTPRAPKGA